MTVRLFSFSRAVVLLLISAGFIGAAAWAEEVITRIADVRSLSREQAAQSRRVRVRGVITWRARSETLTIQDDSAGIWVAVPRSRKAAILATDDATMASLHEGLLVEIEGISDPGGYAPVILPMTIRPLGDVPLPAAYPMSPARFYSGSETDLRGEVSGVVQGYHQFNDEWLLQLSATAGRFFARVPASVLAKPAALVDAEVRLTGVAGLNFNARGEIITPSILCSHADQIVVVTPAVPPFEAPIVSLDKLLPFSLQPIGPHRLRVTGTVTYVLPGKFLYLQEESSAVRVETHETGDWQIGDHVEAAGFVDMTQSVGSLTQALVRRIGRGSAPPAVAISPEEIIAINTAAIIKGLLANPHDFNGHLVHSRASLLAVQSATEADQPFRRLILASDKMIFSAVLYQGETRLLDELLPGSLLDVTGIVQLEYTTVSGSRRLPMPTRLELNLRSALDVQIVSAPSWWTTRRLLGGIAIMLVALVAALLWVWELRRHVRRKTRLLAAEMGARKDAAIEFQATLRERNRLAANLHDTLLQTLGGIGFQIEACEAEAAVARAGQSPTVHLPVARRMLDHALDELRNSVWTLRSLPLHGLALSEALQAMAARSGAGHEKITIKTHTDGDLSGVSDLVAGNLLLVAQEALHNAIKHGQPLTITLEIRPADKPGWIALRVRDDGIGFTPGNQAGAARGHFGLTGMNERIERLNGILRVESAPGVGTTVACEVPVRSYDDELN